MTGVSCSGQDADDPQRGSLARLLFVFPGHSHRAVVLTRSVGASISARPLVARLLPGMEKQKYISFDDMVAIADAFRSAVGACWKWGLCLSAHWSRWGSYRGGVSLSRRCNKGMHFDVRLSIFIVECTIVHM